MGDSESEGKSWIQGTHKKTMRQKLFRVGFFSRQFFGGCETKSFHGTFATSGQGHEGNVSAVAFLYKLS